MKNTLSLSRRSVVGICAPNRPEWLITDFACAFNDYVTVGFHTSWPDGDVVEVLRDAEVECVVTTLQHASRFLLAALSGRCPSLRHLVLLSNERLADVIIPSHLTVTRFSELVVGASHADVQHTCTTHTGAGVGSAIDPDATVRADEADESYTIIYSSGTSGAPKGIVVPKRRWRVDAMTGGVAACTKRVVASYMALAHGGDRGVCWQAAMCGGAVGFARSEHAELLADLRVIQPRFFLGMSHFWNRLYLDYCADVAARLQSLAESCLSERVATGLMLLEDDETVPQLVVDLTRSPQFERVLTAAVDTRAGWAVQEEALSAVRAALGGHLLYAVTGGAHTSEAVLHFMRSCVSPGNEERVFDAYGSTEFPGISVNGEISPAVELRLIDVPEMHYFSTDKPYPRGEIIVRSKDGVMTREYFKRPSLTAETWIDGWYHTGDIGLLDYSEHGRGHPERVPVLRIIDRRKNVTELYIDGHSVWVPMADLEERVYRNCTSVHQICLVSDRNAPSIVAVVVPAQAFVTTWAAQHNPEDTLSVARTCPELGAAVLGQLTAAALAAKLPAHEIPVAVILEHDEWTVANGGLTPVGKPRRGALAQRYKDRMDTIYAELERKEESEGRGRPSSPKTPRTRALPAAEANICVIANSLCSALEAMHAAEPKATAQDVTAFVGPNRRDWMTDFEFKAPNEAAAELMRKAWGRLKSVGMVIREQQATWNDAAKAAQTEARAALAATLKKTSELVRSRLQQLVAAYAGRWASTLPEIADGLSGVLRSDQAGVPSIAEGVSAVLSALRAQKVAVKLAHAAVDAAERRRLPEQEQAWEDLRDAIYDLEVAGEATGVEVPHQLAKSPGWITPPRPGQDEEPPAIAFGDAKVWCYVCGGLIEETVADIGKGRFTSLDTLDVSYCLGCHRLLTMLSEVVAAGCAAGLPGAEAARAELAAFHKYSDDVLARDEAHIIHMQNQVKREFRSDDTPAGIIAKAFVAYGDRLALGIPDPTVRWCDGDNDEASETMSFPSSALVAAARLTPRSHDRYQWLTYRDVGVLACRVARGLISLGLTGSFVGICGHNSFEWAVADFACALAGCGVVGLHATYSTEAAVGVINNAEVAAIICLSDLVTRRQRGLWSVEKVSAKTPPLQHVVLMDARTVNSTRLKQKVSSMCEFVDPENVALDGVELGDPYKRRGVPVTVNGRSEHVFTLLYTSGSSGPPKGVMVSPQSFVNDISERSYAVPLITVSYIPLSHSSDRMKLWEFMGNGGRVGFAYYDASNWAAHETLKKDEMVDLLTTSTNNVIGLFKQIRQLSPSALSLPPRVWNGLYNVYNQKMAHAALSGGATPERAERVRREVAAMFGKKKRVAFLATGGAPTAPDVKDFARALFPRAKFVDSYGTTECGAISSNGEAVTSKGVEVRLHDLPELGFTAADQPHPRGEICVRTPQLTLGYYKDPKRTAEVFVDGWYHTGDLGMIDDFGVLHVLDRISAVCSLQDGSVVCPGRLEALYEQADSVNQIYVHASPDAHHLVALVVPTPEFLQRWASPADDVAEVEEMLRPGSACAAALRHELAQIAATEGLEPHDVPAAVTLMAAEWTEADGLLNANLKKNRRVFATRFAYHIGTMLDAVHELEQGLCDADHETPGDDDGTSSCSAVCLLNAKAEPSLDIFAAPRAGLVVPEPRPPRSRTVVAIVAGAVAAGFALLAAAKARSV